MQVPSAAARVLRVSSHLVASSEQQPLSVPAQEQGVGGSQIYGYWPESLLLHKGPKRDAVLREWRRRRNAAAAAMYPVGMGHTRDEMPCLWTQQEWDEAEAAQRAEPIFDRKEYDAQMCALHFPSVYAFSHTKPKKRCCTGPPREENLSLTDISY